MSCSVSGASIGSQTSGRRCNRIPCGKNIGSTRSYVPTKLTERHSAFSRLTYGLCDGDDDVPDRRLQPPIILDRFKLVYVPIAGCGSTAVKLALHRALGRPDPEPVERVHRFPWPASDHGSNGDGVRLACRSFGFRGLAFVRDPWARLHWAWETLFVKERFGLLRDHHDHLRVDMDFRTFVRQLVYIDVTTAAKPLRRQVDILRLYDRVSVFRLEGAASVWRGLQVSLTMLPALPGVASDPRLRKRHYDRELTFIVGRLYEADVDTYGCHF